MKSFTAFCVFCAVFFVMSCKSTDTQNKHEPLETTAKVHEQIEKDEDPKVPYHMKTITDSAYYLETSICYPVFEDANLSALNSYIEKEIMKNYKDFANWQEDSWNKWASFVKKEKTHTSILPSSYTAQTGEIIFNKKYISFVIWTTIFSAGAANAENFPLTFAYDKKHHRNLTITEATGLTLDEISERCRLALMQKEGAALDDTRQTYINKGTAPLYENFSHFTFDGKTLSVYFDPYTISPDGIGKKQIDLKIK